MDFLLLYLLIGSIFGLIDVFVSARCLKRLETGYEFEYPEELEFAIQLALEIEEHGEFFLFLIILGTNLLFWPIVLLGLIYAIYRGLTG